MFLSSLFEENIVYKQGNVDVSSETVQSEAEGPVQGIMRPCWSDGVKKWGRWFDRSSPHEWDF